MYKHLSFSLNNKVTHYDSSSLPITIRAVDNVSTISSELENPSAGSTTGVSAGCDSSSYISTCGSLIDLCPNAPLNDSVSLKYPDGALVDGLPFHPSQILVLLSGL